MGDKELSGGVGAVVTASNRIRTFRLHLHLLD